MESKEIKVKYVNGAFVPLNRVSFREGDIFEIEVVSEKKVFQEKVLGDEFKAWENLSDEALDNFEKEI